MLCAVTDAEAIVTVFPLRETPVGTLVVHVPPLMLYCQTLIVVFMAVPRTVTEEGDAAPDGEIEII